jgi:DNA helicase-2/ATP-dependent DNA helicase PcrA
MNWSNYQLDIFEASLNTKRNLAVSAVAGSGKTTTLTEVVRTLSGNTLFCAFNVHIAETLSKRIGDAADAKTIHSAGMALLYKKRKPTVDNKKYFSIVREIAKSHFHKSALFHAGKVIVKILGMTMRTLTQPNDFEQMLLTYGFLSDIAELRKRIDSGTLQQLISIVKAIVYESIQKGIEEYETTGKISFDDMLFLPVYYELEGKYDNVLVDEAQDLNASQLALVLALSKKRVISVGDEHQSINGFAGALPDSFEQIVMQTSAKILPLSVCYRCPTSHIALAQELVPHLEARDGAPEGEVQHIKTDEILNIVQYGDLVICRRNAPLIALAFKLIAKKIQARVRGRDFSNDLQTLAGQVEDYDSIDGDFRSGFIRNLQYFYQDKVQILAQYDGNEAAIESLGDRTNCLQVISENTRFDSVEELNSSISGLFSDEASAIYLSSVHRAKGLEGERVIIVDYDKIRINYKGQQEWQKKQEANLEYVALTRAKQSLFLSNK